MKSKGLTAQSIPEMAEIRAQRCQISGHSPSVAARVGTQIRKASWTLLTASRPCLTLLLLIGLSGVLCAQKQQGQWSDLNRLKAGQGIEVIESNLQHHGGEFMAVTDDLLTLREHGSDVSVKREAIVRVSTSSGPRRGEHAAIGLAVGGAIGAAIGAAAGSPHGFLGGSDRGIAALVGIVIGAPTGALVGAVIPAHTTVYRAVPGTSHHTTSP